MKKIIFPLLLSFVTMLLLSFSLVKAQSINSETKILPLDLSEMKSGESWIKKKVTLKRNQTLEIDVANPANELHSLGFQDRIPDSDDSNGSSVYHKSPFLEKGVGYEIWYGANTWCGDIGYFMHWNYWFPRSWTPDCITDVTGGGSEETPNPLVYKIQATDTPETSYIYFFYYDAAVGTGGITRYAQEYFNPCIEVTVE